MKVPYLCTFKVFLVGTSGTASYDNVNHVSYLLSYKAYRNLQSYYSMLSTVISYIPTPCRGLGSEPSENHIKAELWTSILYNTFSFHNPKFVSVWNSIT